MKRTPLLFHLTCQPSLCQPPLTHTPKTTPRKTTQPTPKKTLPGHPKSPYKPPPAQTNGRRSTTHPNCPIYFKVILLPKPVSNFPHSPLSNTQGLASAWWMIRLPGFASLARHILKLLVFKGFTPCLWREVREHASRKLNTIYPMYISKFNVSALASS